MRRVGLLPKHDKPEAAEFASQLAAWLGQEGHQAVVLHNGNAADEIDLLVILGGDGTLLHGAALVAERGIPILGVNLGHLGFLTSCAPADAQPAIMRAIEGKLPLEERLRLRCVLEREGGEEIVKYACNDAVVSQGALARLIELEAFLDGALVTRYRADGLIVGTPTGSTAYTLAAGGPIITPDVRAVVVTPICPHTLTNRPLVAPASSRLVIRLAAPAQHVMVTIDGQWGTQFRPGDTLEISQASPPLYLFRPSESYFEVLRKKLSWGERQA
jgi:NAD+ kinase